ncbi:unnamed protein product [Cuscuta epithymum]|uniref:FAS1 domain-containing protein n=1 Tax=Cuscuta epithymum TaxID=186058 RepID=A0AAV0FN82_9ASTE|nr:unnamed protein product [Cuscuta epithymum]CAH9137097.1 unnamed protein product [Cuscuta epithymum]
MENNVVMFAIASLLIFFSSSINAQSRISVSPAPAPAAPKLVNLTDLLTHAGPYATFLNYAQSTKVIQTFQNQANNSDQGITLFVPKNEAFNNQKKPSLSNLTTDKLKYLMLFHGVAKYYTLADFSNLTLLNTFSGDALNVSDVSGTVYLKSGWTTTKISSSVLATRPVAIYEVDKVLLSKSIFGTNIPPTPAPAPAPDASSRPTLAADAPGSQESDSSSPLASSPPSSSHKVMMSFGPLTQVVLAMAVASAL